MPLPELIIVESRHSLPPVDLRTASRHDHPAGQSPGIDIIIGVERCIGCGVCSEQCPGQAITLSAGKVLRDTSRCNGCGNCVEICPVAVHKID